MIVTAAALVFLLLTIRWWLPLAAFLLVGFLGLTVLAMVLFVFFGAGGILV